MLSLLLAIMLHTCTHTHTHTVSGMAVLKIDRVRKGHEGTYKCVTVNQDGSIRYNIVEVRVLNEGIGLIRLLAMI